MNASPVKPQLTPHTLPDIAANGTKLTKLRKVIAAGAAVSSRDIRRGDMIVWWRATLAPWSGVVAVGQAAIDSSTPLEAHKSETLALARPVDFNS